MKSRTFNAMCPHCREPYVNFKIELLGKKARCVNCGKVFVLTEQNDEDSLIRVDFNPKSPPVRLTQDDGSFAPDSPATESSLLNATTQKAAVSSVSFFPYVSGTSNDRIEETTSRLRETQGLAFGDEFNDSLKDKFKDKFPDPPKGVWQAGEVLLNGMCQVLPLSPNQLYAEGGVGVVQRVRRRDWNVDLIVKSPKPGVVTTESGKENFERECQTWIELGLHANIVSCYFVRRIDGIPRLFAEYAPDGTLRDWISNKRIYTGSPLEIQARLIDIAIQFAWGLEHAHSQGLLHLDVKPGNVMTSGTTIKVTDFGLSKFASELNESGDPASNYCEGMTPSYCSPEQYEAFQIYKRRREEGASSRNKIATVPMTKQSDIWSWAISVLSMFHGRSPCKLGGQTAAEVFEVFLKSQEPGGPRPSMPPGMVELLRWCFQKNPADRPESMQFVADRLVDVYEETIGVKYPRRQPQNAALTAESFSNKAISLLDLGKTTEALELLNEASEIEPNHPLIAFNSSLALWRSGKILDTQAVKRVEELVQNRAFDASSFYVSGLTQIERGNLKSAISAFERVIELDPQRSNVRRLLPQLENLRVLDSQCLTQYVLRKPDENTPPVLYISEDENLLLVELVDGQFATLSAITGETQMKFQPSDASTASSSSKATQVAVSEDYRWNLTIRNDNYATIKPAMFKNVQDQSVRIRFRKVDWNALVARSVKLALRSNKPSSQSPVVQILHFVPEPNGVAVVCKDKIRSKIVDENRTITSFAVSNDGKWIATGNDVSEIKIWNVQERRCVRTFLGLGSTVEGVWFDSQKRYVIALSKGNCCQFFSVQLICNFPEKIHAPHQLCQINSSEELLERQTKFEELVNQAKAADENGDVESVVNIFHKIRGIEGWETTRSVFERLLERRALRSGILELTPSLQISAHEGVTSTLATSWNGSFLASAGKDSTIRVWTRREGKSPNQWGQILDLDSHYDWIRTIALSPNDRFLASAGWDQRVYLWDLASGKRIRTLPEHAKSPTNLVFAPDGRTLALATANGAVTLYDFATTKTLLRLNVGAGEVYSLVFSRDGRFFVTSTDDAVQFWNGRSQLPFKEIKGFPSPILSLDLSCDNNLLIAGCANGKIILIDLPDGRQSFLSGHLGEVSKLKLFSDSKWLVSTGKDKTLRLWDLTKHEETLKNASLDGEITSIALDFTGMTLFTGAENGMVRKWNIQWDYETPTPRNHGGGVNRLITSLTTSHALKEYYAMAASPRNYYGSGADEIPTRFSQTPLNDNLVHLVYAEAQYRGLVDVSYEKLRKKIEKLWKSNVSFPNI